MAVSQRLELRQGQSLVMTPQLQQAIKLLQLSNIELAEYCEQELEKNPLLERDESAPALEPEREQPEAPAPTETLDRELSREDFSKCADMDASGEDRYSDGEDRGATTAAPDTPLADWSTVRNSQRYEGDEDLLDSTVAAGGTR